MCVVLGSGGYSMVFIQLRRSLKVVLAVTQLFNNNAKEIIVNWK